MSNKDLSLLQVKFVRELEDALAEMLASGVNARHALRRHTKLLHAHWARRRR